MGEVRGMASVMPMSFLIFHADSDEVTPMPNAPLQLRRARIDLCVVIAHALHAVESALRTCHHRVVVAYPDLPVWLLGDAARLEQLFATLLADAAKYDRGDMTLSIRQEVDEAIVVFRDAGPGLRLPLPCLSRIVQSHGGRITVAMDGTGRGSELTVRLPAFSQP